jgi:hypothetical protein
MAFNLRAVGCVEPGWHNVGECAAEIHQRQSTFISPSFYFGAAAMVKPFPPAPAVGGTGGIVSGPAAVCGVSGGWPPPARCAARSQTAPPPAVVARVRPARDWPAAPPRRHPPSPLQWSHQPR